MINYAQGSNILIHESTFGSEHDAEAICKKHTTNDEAMGVGQKSNSAHTILTHFSSRYDKVPEITALMKEKGGMVAFDYMSATAQQMDNAKLILGALEDVAESLFSKE